MRRICFELAVKPGHINAYRAAHAAVWADMLEALYENGWTNYSIFLREDGLIIGYFETADLCASLDGMAASAVNARWQAAMTEHFVDGGSPTDRPFRYLDEVFNLDSQRASVNSPIRHN